jgi:hypothetical protein
MVVLSSAIARDGLLYLRMLDGVAARTRRLQHHGPILTRHFIAAKHEHLTASKSASDILLCDLSLLRLSRISASKFGLTGSPRRGICQPVLASYAVQYNSARDGFIFLCNDEGGCEAKVYSMKPAVHCCQG